VEGLAGFKKLVGEFTDMTYNMNYLNQLSPEERLKLSELLAMQQDNSEPGIQYGTGNQQFLSALADPQNSIRTSGFDENFMSGNQQPAPLPQNFIRNERTGVVTDLGQSQPSQPALDYTMPIEMAGIGKGYRLNGDATRAVMADGRIVDMGRDTGEERKRRLADAEIAKREAEVRNLNGPQESTYDKELAKERAKAGVWSVVESAGKQYMLNNKTGEIKPAVVNNAQLPAKADAAAKPTEDENKTAYHASKMLDSINRISQLSNKSKDAMTPGLTEAMAASTAGPYSGTANVARSGDRQAVFGLQTDLVDSLLYLATGAAYNKEQLDQKRESLLPSFTDKPEAIAEKKRSLQEYMKAAKIRSGKAWKPEMEAALNSIYADGAESPKAKAPPANGTVKGGYVFIGGDPAKESSWKKVQ
jgi:hypothetical protein